MPDTNAHLEPHELLVASIGRRDPGSESAPTGPLLAAIRHTPAHVILLSTEEVHQQAVETASAIRKSLPATTVDVEVLDLVEGSGPADPVQTFAAIEQSLARIAAAHGHVQNVLVCPTSGTPQISQALLTVAMTLFPKATFVQALDPKYVTNEQERLRQFDPRITRIRFDLKYAFEALNRFQWNVASSVIESVIDVASPTVDQHRPVLRAAHYLATALSAGDNLNYVGARDAIPDPLDTPFSKDLIAIRQWYARAAKGDRPTLALELASATARFADAALHPRSVVTAISSWEVAVRARLKQHANLDPDKVSERQMLTIPQDLRQFARQFDQAAWRIEGERALRELLITIDQESAVLQHDGLFQPLEDLAKVRNNLVHTGRLEHTARSTVDRALQALSKIFTTWQWGSCYTTPTAPGPLRDLQAKIGRMLGLA